MKLGDGVEVITISDEGLWAFNKPAGILSHPNKPGEERWSLIDAPYDMKEEAYMTDEGPYYLLHRLDGPTSGVILATPHERVAARVKELLKGRKVKKVYNAIVAGVPPMDKALWRDKLTKQRHNEGGVRGVVGGGAPAESQMYVLKKFSKPMPSALLELHPLTGRTHQLRIQCAQRRTPIIGDATYGDFALNRELKAKNLMLHARAVVIEEMNFYAEADLPNYFGNWQQQSAIDAGGQYQPKPTAKPAIPTAPRISKKTDGKKPDLRPFSKRNGKKHMDRTRRGFGGR